MPRKIDVVVLYMLVARTTMTMVAPGMFGLKVGVFSNPPNSNCGSARFVARLTAPVSSFLAPARWTTSRHHWLWQIMRDDR